MSLKEVQIEIVELLVKHERALSQLYKEYAKKFLNEKDFWSKLSAEEIGHANWVQRLHSKIKEGSVYFKEDRFNKEAIKTSLRYLNNQLSKAQMQEMSLMKALSI